MSGCVDTLRLAEELLNLPQSAELSAGDSSQGAAGCELHNDALQDVRVLQTLFGVLQPKAEMISRHKFTLCAMETRPAATCKAEVIQYRPPVEAPRIDKDPHRGTTENFHQ